MISTTRRTIIISLKTKQHYLKFAFILPVFILLAKLSVAQEQSNFEIGELETLFEHHDHVTPKYMQQSPKPKNELEFLMGSGFNIYKTFISSQDNPSCVFYPSCSEYTVQSLQQYGLFVGTLQSFDRLSRCHRLVKPDQYYFNPSNQRFYDPVR